MLSEDVAAYTAPEVLKGGLAASGPVADVYSLAATLYRLVTGMVPKGRINAEAIPGPLREVLIPCLARQPELRNSDVQRLADELKAVAEKASGHMQLPTLTESQELEFGLSDLDKVPDVVEVDPFAPAPSVPALFDPVRSAHPTSPRGFFDNADWAPDRGLTQDHAQTLSPEAPVGASNWTHGDPFKRPLDAEAPPRPKAIPPGSPDDPVPLSADEALRMLDRLVTQKAKAEGPKRVSVKRTDKKKGTPAWPLESSEAPRDVSRSPLFSDDPVKDPLKPLWDPFSPSPSLDPATPGLDPLGRGVSASEPGRDWPLEVGSPSSLHEVLSSAEGLGDLPSWKRETTESESSFSRVTGKGALPEDMRLISSEDDPHASRGGDLVVPFNENELTSPAPPHPTPPRGSPKGKAPPSTAPPKQERGLDTGRYAREPIADAKGYGLMISGLTLRSKKEAAVNILATHRRMGRDEAYELCRSPVVPVLKRVTKSEAESLAEKFRAVGIQARVTERKDRGSLG
jgi:serine/threonine protein kinase